MPFVGQEHAPKDGIDLIQYLIDPLLGSGDPAYPRLPSLDIHHHLCYAVCAQDVVHGIHMSDEAIHGLQGLGLGDSISFHQNHDRLRPELIFV